MWMRSLVAFCFLLFSDIGDIEMYEGTSSPIIIHSSSTLQYSMQLMLMMRASIIE